MRYVKYYDTYADSIHYSNFFVENQCNDDIDYYYRDILVIEINENDSVRTLHLGEDLVDYSKSLIRLYDTTSTAENLPRFDYIENNNEKYLQRHVGVFIYNKMYPDSLTQKTSWKKLIFVTKNVLKTFEQVKNNKSEKIFGSTFKELETNEKKLINDLVPIYLNIYFYLNEPMKIPPPPPLPESLMNYETWSDTIYDLDLEEIEKEKYE